MPDSNDWRKTGGKVSYCIFSRLAKVRYWKYFHLFSREFVLWRKQSKTAGIKMQMPGWQHCVWRRDCWNWQIITQMAQSFQLLAIQYNYHSSRISKGAHLQTIQHHKEISHPQVIKLWWLWVCLTLEGEGVQRWPLFDWKWVVNTLGCCAPSSVLSRLWKSWEDLSHGISGCLPKLSFGKHSKKR